MDRKHATPDRARLRDDAADEAVARRYLRAVIERAQSDLLMVLDLLERAGAIPPPGKGGRPPTAPLPLDLVLKLAACLWLQQWEDAKLRPHVRCALPAAAAARASLRFGGHDEPQRAWELSGRVLGTFLREMAWERAGSRADVVVNAVGTDDEPLDRLAAFLWRHRHAAAATPGAAGTEG